MLENETCYKTGRVSTRDFTVDNCESGGFMLMCRASPGNPWHNFVSDTHRWMDGMGSTTCLKNKETYPIASQYASNIATMISHGAQTIFTTSANATFLGTPLPSKQI